MNNLYLTKKTAIINYTSEYADNYEELMASEAFYSFIENYLNDLKIKKYNLYNDLINELGEENICIKLIRVCKFLTVFDIKEIEDIIDPKLYLRIVEDGYNYWRNLQRFALIYSNNRRGVLTSNFMEADDKFNNLIIGFYRIMQEKLQGHKNYIYRQLHAGTNACLFILNRGHYDGIYSKLNNFPTIQRVIIRAPMIIHLDHNKRIGNFEEVYTNPLDDIDNLEDFLCYPCFVGDSITFVYFHKDYLPSAIGLVNLFEFCRVSHSTKPDCIVLFGIDDNKKETVYYCDRENDIVIGKISKMDIIEYFGYFKKMMLTLHNIRMIQKKYLPIHGAMINLYLKDGTRKGLVLMGDSGAGKSETIDAMSKLKSDISYQEVIFDDMGTMYINDKGEIVCKGTETGAFTRLDDLDASTAYKDIDRSIFFNPESLNSRVVSPVNTYEAIMKENKVDIFLYANNYSKKKGLTLFKDIDKAKEIYKEGKRYAIGTTGETAYSCTYFANPFGPMQRKEECDIIIDEVFRALIDNKIKIGELYTHLSLKDKEEGLKEASEALLKIL